MSGVAAGAAAALVSTEIQSPTALTDGDAAANATAASAWTTAAGAAAVAADDGGGAQQAIESLYPALVQTFLCIFLGYGAGRLRLISAEQAAGVGTYVSKFALPALLFQNMATLDWSTVEWRFMAAVGLSKLSVYLAVLTVGLLVTRPLNLAASAICAIFVSQSNDFALGYPIVKAMYGRSRPEFIHYIYLLAPLSLCILNPAAFALIECHKQRLSHLVTAVSGTANPSAASEPTIVAALAPGSRVSTTERGSTCLRICASVFKGLITNPIVLFTGFGLAANFVFRHSLPLAIRQFVDVVGQSFSASALFYLGLSIVGKLGADLSRLLLVCCSLIVVKLIVFPFITMEYTKLLGCGTDTNSTADYAMFGYLYGTIPTAPTVFVFATHYAVLPDLVATGMVLCTMASAPLMFVSSVMVSMRFFSFDYLVILRQASFDLAVLSAVCSPWVIIVFLLTRRLQHVLHKLSIGLATCQMLIAVGVLVNHAADTSAVVAAAAGSGRWAPSLAVAVPCLSSNWGHVFNFALFACGLHGSRVFTALIAVAVALASRGRRPSRRGNEAHPPYASAARRNRLPLCGCHWLTIVGILTPLAVVSVTLLMSIGAHGTQDTSCFDESLDRVELGMQTVVLLISIVTSVICLVLKHRWDASPRGDPIADLHHPRLGALSSHKKRIRRRLGRVKAAADTALWSPDTASKGPRTPKQRNRLSANDSVCPDSGPLAQGCADIGRDDVPTSLEQPQSPMHLSPTPADAYSDVELDSYTEEDDDREEDDEAAEEECLLLLPVRGDSPQLTTAEVEHSSAADRTVHVSRGYEQPPWQQQQQQQRLSLLDATGDQVAPPGSHASGSAGCKVSNETSTSVGRHCALLILQLLVMSSSLSMSILRLVSLDMVTSGIYIEIVFMDATLIVGQGFLTFALFGLDLDLVLRPLWNRLKIAGRWVRRKLSPCGSYVTSRRRVISSHG